jgi:hypothetical protein
MKKSQHAPRFSPDQALEAFRLTKEWADVEQDGRYLHWEEIRHRPTAAGLKPELAWQLVKLARAQIRQPLYFFDDRHRPAARA